MLKKDSGKTENKLPSVNFFEKYKKREPFFDYSLDKVQEKLTIYASTRNEEEIK